MKKNRIFKQNISKISSKFYLFVGLMFFFLCGSASGQSYTLDINSPAQFELFADSVSYLGIDYDGCIVNLNTNIDDFNRIIGENLYFHPQPNYFKGTFDGKGHTISIFLDSQAIYG